MTPTPHLDQKLSELETLCKEKGIPLTLQRRLVLKTVSGRKDHPSADEIYDTVRGSGLSRTTVYRVLDTLVRLGLVAKVNHPDSVVRFDPITKRHHHLVCGDCGSVSDISDPALDSVSIPRTEHGGFTIQDYSIYFQGVCTSCNKDKTKEK